MAGMSFGGAMDQRLRLANDNHSREWFDAQTRRIIAETPHPQGGGGGGGAVAATPSDGMNDNQRANAAYDKNVLPTLGASPTQGITRSGNSFTNTAPAASPLHGSYTSRPAGQFETPMSIMARNQSQSPAEKYSANPFDSVGRGPYPDLDPPGSRGKTLHAENAAGKMFTGPSNTHEADIFAPRTGLDPSDAFKDSMKERQGLRKGTTYVKDKKGRGNPKKDTVDAKLAEGEAVLNAGAAELLGRDKIAQLNAEGAKKMGLRGGPQMKDGVLHAVVGAERIKAKDLRDALKSRAPIGDLLNETPEQSYASEGNAGARAEAEAAAKTAKTIVPKAGVTPPAVPTLKAAGRMLGGAASVGSYMAAPAEEQGGAAAGFGPFGTAVGLAHKALQPMREKVYGDIDNATGFSAAVDPYVERLQAKMPWGQGVRAAMTTGDAKLEGRATDAGVNGVQVPVPAGYVPPSPERDAAMQQEQTAQQRTLRDNKAYSEFFNSRGITDEMRKNAATPKWNDKPIGHDKPGIWNMRDVANIQDGGSQIYKVVDKDGKVSYIGTGSQSRYEDEQARANDPAVKKEAVMSSLRNAAMTGDKQAADMYERHLQTDALLEAERMRGASELEQAKVTAGAKAKGDKGGASLNDLLKLGTTLIGEGREAELLQAVNQRKQVAVDQLIKAGKVDAAKEVQAAEADQDFIVETANLMRQREAGAQNSQASRAGWGGSIGAGLGAAAGLYLGLRTKKPKLIRAGWGGLGGLGGALGLGGYGYATGSQGVDEFTDLNRIAGLGSSDGDLVGDGITIPGQFLTDDQKVLRGLRK